MLTEKDAEPLKQDVTDHIELDDFVEPPDRTHHDRFARQSHDLPNEAAEASSRALVRVVPLAYGALLGGLADTTLLGISVGLILSMAFDLNMGRHSMARALSRRLCPVIARLVNLLAKVLRRFGVKAPAALAELRCTRGWL